MEIVGDVKSWHIRLVKRVDSVEIWSLYNGEKAESSPMPKSIVLKWMNDELQKGNQ